MSDETLAERIVRLETQITTIIDAHKAKAGREWAIIMVGIGLVVSILAKNLGWVK
jgi:hypothetical protein